AGGREDDGREDEERVRALDGHREVARARAHKERERRRVQEPGGAGRGRGGGRDELVAAAHHLGDHPLEGGGGREDEGEERDAAGVDVGGRDGRLVDAPLGLGGGVGVRVLHAVAAPQVRGRGQEPGAAGDVGARAAQAAGDVVRGARDGQPQGDAEARLGAHVHEGPRRAAGRGDAHDEAGGAV
ncbi:hypothetical protein EG861_14410, partial [Enterococcus faecalis]